jgi:hypothetical protein
VDTPALPERSANQPTSLSARVEKLGLSLRTFMIRTKRAILHTPEAWRRLTAGMELNDLWTQFKEEAETSSRPYKQDMDLRAVNDGDRWKHPFKVVTAFEHPQQAFTSAARFPADHRCSRLHFHRRPAILCLHQRYRVPSGVRRALYSSRAGAGRSHHHEAGY